jgi:hypothetical protein
MKWTYAVTTCLRRLNTLLPRTLASLATGGFERPRVFADDVSHEEAASLERRLGLPVTSRHPALLTSGHWILTLYELLIRDHTADRYAIFQDDLVTSKSLRAYLEATPYPERGYLNLYTFPSNQTYYPPGRPQVGWFKSRPVDGNQPQFQTGRGALALVFSREAVITLLSARPLVEKAIAAEERTRIKRIDGGIVNAMNLCGWSEYVHDPSLVQHTGVISTIDNQPHPEATSFKGEDYDLMTLLSPPPSIVPGRKIG